MDHLPWGVFIIMSIGLSGTAYVIYYILRLAYEETKDDSSHN